MKDLREALGGSRRITVCRELTKKYETAWQTTLDGAVSRYEEEEPKGEFVLVIEGKSLDEIREEKVRSWEEMSVEDHMALYEGQGMDRKEAMKQVAKDRGVSKREIYQMLL